MEDWEIEKTFREDVHGAQVEDVASRLRVGAHCSGVVDVAKATRRKRGMSYMTRTWKMSLRDCASAAK